MQISHRGMNQESVIADIEQKARDVGVPIRDLCRRAGLNPTTFSRWKQSERNPDPIGANLHSIGRLYDALAEIETETGVAAPDSHRLCEVSR